MDSSLQIDYSKVTLKEGDIFLVTSDGVHDFLDEEKIIALLKEDLAVQEKAEKFVALSVAAESDDNISCAVLIINQLPQTKSE